MGTPYKYGGNDLSGIDCSGLTKNVFSKAVNITIPRTAREQFEVGKKVEKSELEFGDLVFFDTQKKSFPGHVGIILDNNFFVHSSSSRGVIISSLHEDYYKKKYVGAKRLIKIK